jgi:Dihydroxyacetone kinase
MQRIINDPNQVVEDMLEGFVYCHSDILHVLDGNKRVIVRNGIAAQKKVGVVTGGGSGHKPAFIGYIGRNMLDAVAVGEIFSSPTAKSFYDAFCAADSGAGVACLYGNYAGDNMNVRMAKTMAEEAGVEIGVVVANDDVASAPLAEREKRRGVAGEVLMWKFGGAKASLGASLEDVVAVAQKAIDNTRSVGIGLGPCTIPANGKPNFIIEDGKVEFGIGHHGEPGICVEQLGTADEMADRALEIIVPDLPFCAGDEVAVLVSGLGATPVMEQYIFYNRIRQNLKERDIKIYGSYVGNYFTSLDMNGITVTITKLDEELKQLLDIETDTVGLTQFGRK